MTPDLIYAIQLQFSYGLPPRAIAARFNLEPQAVVDVLVSDLLAREPCDLTPEEASACHLIDLKRAGYSPRVLRRS